jgi:beta-galactosidase
MKRIKETGFTFVRLHAIDPEVDAAGLITFPHFQMLDTAPATRRLVQAISRHYRGNKVVACCLIGGEPHATGIPLTDEKDQQAFRAWLKKQYGSPAAVHRAWSIYPSRRPQFVTSWDDALRIACTIKKGTGLVLATTEAKHEVYGTTRDLMRFRADQMCAHHRAVAAMIRRVDPTRPIWVGNHQLMLNQAQLGWDVMESGRTADVYYTSIHLSWHFEPSDGEVDRPVYMQSRLTHDAFKGGHTSAYETTGGPVQYSGGFGNHMDAGLMRRLMFNYLAAGNQSIAFWDWVCRPGGIEAGEYGLVTLSGKVSEWAREAGRVARHAALPARNLAGE